MRSIMLASCDQDFHKKYFFLLLVNYLPLAKAYKFQDFILLLKNLLSNIKDLENCLCVHVYYVNRKLRE